MSNFAIIGGTGLTRLDRVTMLKQQVVETPYGMPSAALTSVRGDLQQAWFLPRHGDPHQIPPHRINYRANIWALHHLNVKRIIAVFAVGGVDDRLAPGDVVFPDQILDYTWGRAHTFYEEDKAPMQHIDFRQPYTESLRQHLVGLMEPTGATVHRQGVYGAAQGPRYETLAEVKRLTRDGCTIVGMTGMPEAALARELDMQYAAIAVVMNQANSRAENLYSKSTCELALQTGMNHVLTCLSNCLALPYTVDDENV